MSLYKHNVSKVSKDSKVSFKTMKFDSTFTEYMKEWDNFMKNTNMSDWSSDDGSNDGSGSDSDSTGSTGSAGSTGSDVLSEFSSSEVGQVVRWFPKKKFGFIKGKTKYRDIFFLQTEYTKNSGQMPQLNQKVKMTLTKNNKGGFVARDIYCF